MLRYSGLALAALALWCAPSPAKSATTVATGKSYASNVARYDEEKRFHWKGSCTVVNNDNKAETIYQSGDVYARDFDGARRKAETEMQYAASRYGKVLYSTLKVDVY